MESSFNPINPRKALSFSIKILDKNPTCLTHNSAIIAVCLQSNCPLKGGICITCLLNDHFKDHDKVNIITLNEFLDSLDEFFVDNLEEKNTEMFDTKIKILDQIENFKSCVIEKIEEIKNKVNDHFQSDEYFFQNPQNLSDYLYTEISKNQVGSNIISDLINRTEKLGINFSHKEKKFVKTSVKKKINILNEVNFDGFFRELLSISTNLQKKLVIEEEKSSYFKTFNLEDNNTILMKEGDEGIIFKKVSSQASTYLVISNEDLDFNKVITWKVKLLNLPSRWFGIGIIPREKFNRTSWNSTDLVGINCDGYYLNRGINNSNPQWNVPVNSVLSFIFNGPEQFLKIIKNDTEIEFRASDLDKTKSWCLALYFHYSGTEIVILK